MSITPLQLKPICNHIEHFQISLDVVELRDFWSSMIEQVRHLFLGKGFDVFVYVLHAVDQPGGEGVTEAVLSYYANIRDTANADHLAAQPTDKVSVARNTCKPYIKWQKACATLTHVWLFCLLCFILSIIEYQ